MSEKQMMTQDDRSLASLKQAAPLNRQTPNVDIYETPEELVLLADLPGVLEQGLQVEISHGILTLEAEQEAAAKQAKARYYRQFKISDRIDVDAGEAALKDGVLTLKLPKTAAARPKKIAVKTLH